MPIFCDTRVTSGAGRSFVSSPCSSLSMLTAAAAAVRHRPDDVLRPERRVAAEQHARQGRLVRGLVDDRHAPFVEGDAEVALDPRERVLLPDRDQHLVAVEALVRLAGGDQLAAAARVAHRAHLLEGHADEFPVFVQERLRHAVVEDRDAFVHRVLLLHGLAFISSKPERTTTFTSRRRGRQRAAAAVHRGVAAAEHEHALADLVDVAEIHVRQPVEADMDVACGGFLPAGNVEVAAARAPLPTNTAS